MKKFMATLCAILTVLCVSFAFSGCFGDDDSGNTAENFEQYYVDDCPLTVSGEFQWNELRLTFENVSEKNIITYELMYIFYDIYGKSLVPSWSDTPNLRSESTPPYFPNGQTAVHCYKTTQEFYSAEVYSAQVYVFYALFEDKTSWGCRENISNEKIVEFATKYRVERYSY